MFKHCYHACENSSHCKSKNKNKDGAINRHNIFTILREVYSISPNIIHNICIKHIHICTLISDENVLGLCECLSDHSYWGSEDQMGASDQTHIDCLKCHHLGPVLFLLRHLNKMELLKLNEPQKLYAKWKKLDSKATIIAHLYKIPGKTKLDYLKDQRMKGPRTAK